MLIAGLLFAAIQINLAEARDIFAILGGQRVGTSAMTFLKIPVGARAEGMGGAYVAIANDPFAIYWNPAGIAQISNRWSGRYAIDPDRREDGGGPVTDWSRLDRGGRAFGAVRINWIADVTYDYLSYIHPLPVGYLGISAASLGVPDMEITTEYQPDGTGEFFSYGDMMFGLTYAMEMTDNFSWGTTFKYAREDLAGNIMENVMFDVGTYYWTGFRDLRLGVSLVHFGPNSAPDGSYTYVDVDSTVITKDYKAYAPPTEFRLGGAITPWVHGPHRVLVSMQLNHPVDNSENFKFGAEYAFMGMVFLRGGYKVNTDEDHWAFGAGTRVPWRGIAFTVDYSYTDFGILENAQRLSIGITF